MDTQLRVNELLSKCLKPDASDPAYFFFQAEDGIRADLVTGVQTCALPIYDHLPARAIVPSAGKLHGFLYQIEEWSKLVERRGQLGRQSGSNASCWMKAVPTKGLKRMRSEERRVGKECRSR